MSFKKVQYEVELSFLVFNNLSEEITSVNFNNNNNNNNRLYLKRVTHLVTKLIFHEA